jgi:hypothetical protein
MIINTRNLNTYTPDSDVYRPCVQGINPNVETQKKKGDHYIIIIAQDAKIVHTCIHRVHVRVHIHLTLQTVIDH